MDKAATIARYVILTWVFIHAVELTSVAAEEVELWRDGVPLFSLDLPHTDDDAAELVRSTLERHLGDFFHVSLPSDDGTAGLRIVAGSIDSNSVLARMSQEGTPLTSPAELGEEGFQLLLGHDNGQRVLVINGRTPRALKHGCQELVFFRTRATAQHGVVEWPMNIVRRPQITYRGSYMLPCWAQLDSVESWKRVLRFHSELTLNRNWFWLDGFPVAGHPAKSHEPGRPADYDKSPLANNDAVRSLIELSNKEAMKFLIGGGWMSWHHEQVAGKDPAKARQFYLDYLREFPDIAGFYFEPTGEGTEVTDWRPEAEALKATIEHLFGLRPTFEVAIAIGRFNNAESLKLMSSMDPKRTFWWWCWGNPHTDGVLSKYPSTLGWHTTVRMTDFHGTTSPPEPADRQLAGVVTSYDPGMGFGNPWNGFATLGGATGPRNFDPYTMPYFSHEYRYREHCWNTEIGESEFADRLAVRLFDSDMPADAVVHYLKLADFCFRPATADEEALRPIEQFTARFQDHGTARNRDTLTRMAEALRGIRHQK